MLKVEDLYTQIMLNREMMKIPIGYQSYCLTAIRETLSKNGISMEREVNIELSESLLESISDADTTNTDAAYDELFR